MKAMESLKGFSPIRRSLQFDLVGQRHVDEFFEKHFCTLVLGIYRLASMAFCPQGESKIESSPWKGEYSSQFDKYVELVARPDPSRGEWEMLLRNRLERRCTLQAIITKILEAEAFSSPLFGAEPGHLKELEGANLSMFSNEGFQRSRLRAQANCNYLKPKSGLPPLFWDEVDELCARVLTLLMPLYEWTSKAEGSQPAPLTEVYQCFHDTLSHACWLSVCIQTSPGIFHYDWSIPGERYRLDQLNFDQELYERSKEATSSIEQETVARVKISVIPKILRYVPAVSMSGIEGIAKYTMMQPHVLYYHGRRLDQDEDAAYVSLAKYLRRNRLRKRERDEEGLYIGSPQLALVTIFLFVWVVRRLPYGLVWALLKHFVTDVGVPWFEALVRLLQRLL